MKHGCPDTPHFNCDMSLTVYRDFSAMLIFTDVLSKLRQARTRGWAWVGSGLWPSLGHRLILYTIENRGNEN